MVERRLVREHQPFGETASDAMPNSSTAGEEAAEWDTLTTTLNRWGVLHVAPMQPQRTDIPATSRELFKRLFSAREPRLHQSTVFLLLTHPKLATDARMAIGDLQYVQRDRAMRRYVAAAALQQMARTRIALALGPQPLIPPDFVDDLDLPSLDEEFGRATLWALADQERKRYGYDAWGTYRAMLDLFLGEIRRRGWGVECDNGPTKRD